MGLHLFKISTQWLTVSNTYCRPSLSLTEKGFIYVVIAIIIATNILKVQEYTH